MCISTSVVLVLQEQAVLQEHGAIIMSLNLILFIVLEPHHVIITIIFIQDHHCPHVDPKLMQSKPLLLQYR